MLAYFLYYLLQYESIPPIIAGTGPQLPGIILCSIPVGPFFVAPATASGQILAALVTFGDFCGRHRGILLGALVWSKKTLSTSKSRENGGWFPGWPGCQSGRRYRLRPLAASRRQSRAVARSGFPGSSHRPMWRSFRIHVKTTGSGKRCFQHFARSWRTFGSIGQLVLYWCDTFLCQALYFLNWQ